MPNIGSVFEGVRQTFLVAVTVTAAIAAPVPALAGTDRFEPEPAAEVPALTDYLPAAIRPGSEGVWVERLQRSLAGSGFRPGEFDGVFGGATLGAVYAFQKVHGLERDGVFYRDYWRLLGMDIRVPQSEIADRVEVDLDRQVLFLIEAQEVTAVLPISSGNGEPYRNGTGSLVRARTPEGAYHFYKHIDGWRISYLGALYRPFYFRGGYAIHGSPSVPPYPASHGCVRVEIHDMDFLTTQLAVGMPIFVYGRTTERNSLLPEMPVEPVPDRPLPSAGGPYVLS